MSELKALARPTKEFFIDVIIKDISLLDCILDLLDNSLDGARRVLQTETNGDSSKTDDFSQFQVAIELSKDRFTISDNCGGIALEDAKDYAFHFGRRLHDRREPRRSIGLYGIGMKRAMFKIGACTVVTSSTPKGAFIVTIDVRDWLHREEWDFPLEELTSVENAGTEIEITELHQEARAAFAGSTFSNELRRVIGRDYTIFLQKGFRVEVNQTPVADIGLALRTSDDFKPARISYLDERTGVTVEIVAGMAASPPEDDSADADIRNLGKHGWFVICNDRVVLAADKTELTVWGRDKFPGWHYQYNGFLGVVSFHSDDAVNLPWTTTKRSVDPSSLLYRRALAHMQEVTRTFIDYTSRRKSALDRAKGLESRARAARVQFTPTEEIRSRQDPAVPKKEAMAVPGLPEAGPLRVKVVSVQYSKPREEVKRAAEALGDADMPATRVGSQTFDYFLRNETDA